MDCLSLLSEMWLKETREVHLQKDTFFDLEPTENLAQNGVCILQLWCFPQQKNSFRIH